MSTVVINHNLEAMNSYRNLSASNLMLGRSLERLSSGYRINRASDDAAGLAISEKMRSQIGGMNAAMRNAQDTISLVRVAEGALGEVNADLVRMRELAVLGSTDVLTSADRLAYQNEFVLLQKHVERVVNTTEFNTRTLLNGSLSSNATGAPTTLDNGAIAKHLTIQVGANVGQVVSMGIVNLRIGTWATGTGVVSAGTTNGLTNFAADYVGGLNIGYSGAYNIGTVGAWATVGGIYSTNVQVYTRGPVDIKTISKATTALWRIDEAVKKVAYVRAKLGALENAMQSSINSLANTVENLQAAESRIRDTDMAYEMTQFTRAQIMSQAGIAMLAQANMMPQNVLALLR
jgi:flagellin